MAKDKIINENLLNEKERPTIQPSQELSFINRSSLTKFIFSWPLIGNSHIVEFLEKSLIKKRVAGFYIFNGPDNLGKTTIARYFAQCLLCENLKENSGKLPCKECFSCAYFKKKPSSREEAGEQEEIGVAHGDFHIIKKEKDKKNISVEQIRNFIKILGLSSFLGGYKIGIIKHAEDLSVGAANSLLKTLEEPKQGVVIILVTDKIEFLPKTIVSRAQILNFRLVKADIIYEYLIEKYQTSRSMAKNFARLCLGRPALAIKFLENKNFYEQYKEKVDLFLKFINQDINERISAIEKLTGAKSFGQKTVAKVKRTMEIWQGILRDRILLEFNCRDIIQHHIFEQELGIWQKRLSLPNTLKLIKSISDGEEKLASNVNPKTVLETIAIDIN